MAGGAAAKAKHREIAIRYRQGRKAISMSAIRCAELSRIFDDRYGNVLPDDDAGRDDCRIMLHHLALMSGDQMARMSSWIAARTPWMSPDEARLLIDQIIAKPLRWTADKLAKRLNLTDADRSRLRIRTIGAADTTKAERDAAREVRKRKAEMEQRRAKGIMPRCKYEAAAIGHGKPWVAAGLSRASWYRRQQQVRQ